MTRALVLAMSLLAVLASAIIGARMLVDAPITLPPLPPPPPSPEPLLVARPALRPSFQAAPDRVVTQPTPVAQPVARQQVEPPMPPEPIDEQPQAQPSEPADRAIAEAMALVMSDQVLTPELARSAAEIFGECLRTRPLDSRCNRGLRLANRRQLRTLPLENYQAHPGLPLPRARPLPENEPE